MTDGPRAWRTSEPGRQGPAGAQRWSDYLDWLRAEVVGGVVTLPAAEQRRSRLPSGWTPVEMLSHVVHMEQRWFVWGFLGEPVPDPWGDWSTDEPWVSDSSTQLRDGARWHVPAEVSVESLVARAELVAQRTREVLRDHPSTSVAAAGGRFDADPPSLEWICFHVVTEYARHAGQLDIVRELAADRSPPPGGVAP